MKKLYITLILLFVFMTNNSSASNLIVSYSTIKSDSATFNTELIVEMSIDSTIMVYFDGMPEFPGGGKALNKFIYSNIKYPRSAIDKRIEGVVIISYIVEIDGSISNVTLVKGIGSECDEEALRVIRKLPSYIVSKQSKSPSPVKMTIPINFSLGLYKD